MGGSVGGGEGRGGGGMCGGDEWGGGLQVAVDDPLLVGVVESRRHAAKPLDRGRVARPSPLEALGEAPAGDELLDHVWRSFELAVVVDGDDVGVPEKCDGSSLSPETPNCGVVVADRPHDLP